VLDEVFTALGLDRIVLGGYSLGGRLALHYALQGGAEIVAPRAARRRLAGLVLESASPGIEDEGERHARRAADEELAAFVLRQGIERFVERWEQTPVLAGQTKLPPESAAELRHIRLGCSADGLAASLRFHGAGAMPFLGRARFESGVPVLVMAGAEDVKYREIAERLCAQLRGARLRIVEDAGHSVHLERPQVFVRHVEEFLSGCDRSPARTEVKSA